MTLTIDERTVRTQTCPTCGSEYSHVTGFVLNDGGAHAVYFVACHGHPDHEAWVDVILGTWGDGDGESPGDHVTFSCQLRQEGAAAVDAPVATEGRAGMFGRKLTRTDALTHPWIGDFWKVVDLLAEADSAVQSHVYG